MTQLLMLDAAYPPSPGDLIADITTVGGQGAFLYVWGPYVNGSPAHVQALRQAGLVVAPIIVPGNLGGDPPTMVGTCKAWGFLNGPVFFDFERGSLPSNEWWDNARDIFRANGFHPDRYGTTSVLGFYDPGDADWIASWIRTGILEPLPELPQGWSGWQFVNDITINGHQYDASVMDASLFGGQNAMTEDEVRAFFARCWFDYLHKWPDQETWDWINSHYIPGWFNRPPFEPGTSNPVGALQEFIERATAEANGDIHPVREVDVASLPAGPKGDPGPPGPPGKDGVPQPGTYPVEGTFTLKL